MSTNRKVKNIGLYAEFDEDNGDITKGVAFDFDPPLLNDDGEESIWLLTGNDATTFREIIEGMCNLILKQSE